MKTHVIASILYKVGINYCVDVPPDVCRSLSDRGYIPVVARVAGVSVRTTLLPAGGGRRRLYLNGEMRKAAGVANGDIVSVVLRPDGESRELAVPDDLKDVLRKVPGARTAYNSITPNLRQEFLRWVENAKQPETRARRIQIGIERMIQRAMKSRKASSGKRTHRSQSSQ